MVPTNRPRRRRARRRVTVQGEEKLMRKFRTAGQRMADEMQTTGTPQAAHQVAQLARSLAPVDTGQLQSSIEVRPLERQELDRNEVGTEVVVTRDAWYGRFQEFGTPQHSPQAFLTPALEQSRQAARRRLEQAAQRQVRQEGRP